MIWLYEHSLCSVLCCFFINICILILVFPFLCAILLVDFIPFYICLFLHLHTYTQIEEHIVFFYGKTLSSSFNFIAVDWKISNDLLLLCFVYETASAASERKEEISLRDKWSLDLLMKNWFSFDTFFFKRHSFSRIYRLIYSIKNYLIFSLFFNFMIIYMYEQI